MNKDIEKNINELDIRLSKIKDLKRKMDIYSEPSLKYEQYIDAEIEFFKEIKQFRKKIKELKKLIKYIDD